MQCGHSTDQRPDLPQLNINLSTLDPLGLPLTATVGKGNCAADPRYVPEIDRVRETLKKHGLLFVGDSKMAALATRTPVAAGGEYYWWPLPAPHMPAAALAALLAPGRRRARPCGGALTTPGAKSRSLKGRKSQCCARAKKRTGA